jgi:acetylornithine deacetylase/succinyl-diaminopimelate desuccinylase-like protein
VELHLGERENPGRSLSEAVAWPALNIVGLRSGDVGADARNAIPTEAAASLDFRLVPRQTPEGVRRIVEDHLRKAGYRVLSERAAAESAPDRDRLALIEWGDSGYAGARVRDDAPPVHALIDVLRAIHGDELVVTPILGGSLPLSLFADPMPKTAIVVLPIVNYDNNQHAANENVTLGSLRLGVATFTAILGAYAPPASVQ